MDTVKLNDALSRVPWQDFEILVANRYRRHGWYVAHCGDGHPASRAENEVDLRMRKDSELALVQCRHESLPRFDAGTVARLLATAAEEGATQVFVIASADVPEDARQLAESGGAAIIEGEAVRRMLDDDLLDLRPVRAVAALDARREPPRPSGMAWRLPLFLAVLTILGLIAFYGAGFAREGLEHPRPVQVDRP